MRTKFKLSINQVLNHLEYSVFYFFLVIGTFYISTDFSQTLFSYFLFRTKENLSLVCSLCNVFIHINSDENSNSIYIVQKWTQRKITRCSQKSDYSIKILDVLVMLQYALKFFHEGIAILIRKEIRIYY